MTCLRNILLIAAVAAAGCEMPASWQNWGGSREPVETPITPPHHQAVLRPSDGMVMPGDTAAVGEAATRPAAQGARPFDQPPGTAPPDAAAQADDKRAAFKPVADDEAPAIGKADSRPKTIELDSISFQDNITAPTTRPATAAVTSSAVSQSRPARVLSNEVVGASMVQVNDKFVTLDDVIRGIGPPMKRLPSGLGEAELRTRAAKFIEDEIRHQVTQQLVLGEAKNRLTDQQKEHIDKEMDDTLRDMVATLGQGSKKKLEEETLAQGAELKDVLAEQRRQLTIRVYLRMRFTPTIDVTQKMLWSYYRSHKNEFLTPRKIQMQTICIPWKAGLGPRATAAQVRAAHDRGREAITAAAQELAIGTDFGDVAKRFSKDPRASSGGTWDLMAKGNFKEQKVEEAAFKLAPHQIAGPIETDDAFYIVKCRRVEAGKTMEFADAQEQIDNKLREQQFEAATEEYFKTLLKNATIVQKGEFMQMALDYAAREYFKKK
ncbi:MAG: peptidyl-prolyl cis-trans isomerase [Planctomycetaceae bacterium]|nr:peptidyl-prolyl cis-trans isomerase [Planctomycetaceae bacterium]